MEMAQKNDVGYTDTYRCRYYETVPIMHELSIDIVTVPEHCPVYPLLFEWCKTFGVHDLARIYEIQEYSYDCPSKKMHCQNTNKIVWMAMILAESSMLVGCSYLANYD